MPVNVQSLAQSLQSLSIETDPLLGGDFAPLSRQPNSYRALDAVDTSVKPAAVALAFPPCPSKAPPPPPVPPRLSSEERERRVMDRFFNGWGLTGERKFKARRALLDSVASLRKKDVASTDEALLGMSAANFLSADLLLRCFNDPDMRATVLQEIAPLWDIDLTWFARDATDLCEKMLPDDARRLAVVRCLARRTVSDRRELMVLLKNKRFATMGGSDGARCMDLLVTLPVETLRFLTKACEFHKKVLTSEDVRALAHVPNEQWEPCLQTLRRRAQRESLTEEGVQRLFDLYALGGYPHVVLHRALAFVNDAHHRPVQQSILDGNNGDEPTVRARASATLRRMHGHAHKAKASSREVDDARFFAQCWCVAERHPTASYGVRFALAQALGQPTHGNGWTFQQTMLMHLHPLFPALRLAGLATALHC